MPRLAAAAAGVELDDSPCPPPWLRHAEELLNDCFADPLTMKEVAAGAGVHPVHLARTFRAVHRCTPGEYLRSRRLAKAVELLVAGRHSLVEIALVTGYADQAHFNKSFRSVFGISPGRYRDLIGGNRYSAADADQDVTDVEFAGWVDTARLPAPAGL